MDHLIEKLSKAIDRRRGTMLSHAEVLMVAEALVKAGAR